MYQPRAVWRPGRSRSRWMSAGPPPTLSLTYFTLHPFLLSLLLFAPFIRTPLSCRNQKFKERSAVVRATGATRPPAASVVQDQSGLISFASDQRRPRSFVFAANVAGAAIVALTTGSECAHASSRRARDDGGEASPAFRPCCWVFGDKQIQFCSAQEVLINRRHTPDQIQIGFMLLPTFKSSV